MYLLEKGQIPRGARKVQISTKLTGAGLGSIFFSQKKNKQGLASSHADGK
jgi:mevalonate kinase